jgi:hypothetical protein
MKKIIFILAFLLFTQVTLAHQPRIVDKEMTIVKNPEISQAFYGELNGEPEYYKITSDKEFELYLGVLVPDIEGIDKDISFTVYKDEEVLWDFDGLNHEWTYFWEEFGGDGYYDGPELRSNPNEEYPKGVMADSGTYEVKVYSPDNEGKYVLAIGTIESFPLGEILNTIKTLPTLKSDFFGKSALSAFNNKIGMFIFGPVILLIMVAGIVMYVIRRYKRKKL